jgi:hypothetical protein|tara:strand:- start:905 stop:1081 length:177 start_codon:yes stop_codon:yes gene_type:complete
MKWNLLGLIACLLSIIGSIYIFVYQDENLGIFVGLWASALLLLSERVPQVLAEMKNKE